MSDEGAPESGGDGLESLTDRVAQLEQVIEDVSLEKLRDQQSKHELALMRVFDQLERNLRDNTHEALKRVWEDSRELDSKVKDLRTELAEARQELDGFVQARLSAISQGKNEKLWYFIPLGCIVGITILLIGMGITKEVDVSIDYNVGEIIGGLLAGVGVLVAGVSYMFRGTPREQPPPRQ